MPKQKELKTVSELYSETISKYTLEERVKLEVLLITGIRNEANALKQKGEEAAKMLEKIENGK